MDSHAIYFAKAKYQNLQKLSAHSHPIDAKGAF
jgi:hypothetical protein